MGKRGPAPKPSVLKDARGKRGANLADNIKPDVAIPECPNFVCETGRREWARITPYLMKLGLISHLDMAALALYCQTFGRYADLETGFEENIRRIQQKVSCPYTEAVQLAFIDVTPNGYKQVSALASTIRGLREECLRYLAQFGLSPSARTRVPIDLKQLDLPGIDPAPVTDPWESFGSRVQ